MSSIHWIQTCCAWHGEYAEHPTKDGGITRLKRSAEKPGIVLVSRFSASNVALDVDAEGVPKYVEMAENELPNILT